MQVDFQHTYKGHTYGVLAQVLPPAPTPARDSARFYEPRDEFEVELIQVSNQFGDDITDVISPSLIIELKAVAMETANDSI